MTGPSLTLREADADDLDRVETLLEANDLPSRDVRTSPGRFFVARSDAERVGVGGLEVRGSDGLLRSVVIAEPSRGRGHGTALCEALENEARENGVATLYLLTTTAAGFFRGCGYEPVDRETVPAGVRRTTEFSDLCPASATCMRKHLDP